MNPEDLNNAPPTESPSHPITTQPSGVPPISSSTTTVGTLHKSKRGKAGIFILFIALIFLLGGGYYYYSQIYKKETTKEIITTNAKKDVPLIRYGSYNGPANSFYPKNTYDVAVIFINSQIFEGLVSYTSPNKIEPLLATSWKNPNDTTWIFTLKPNVKFHDGATMTADDVVYSLSQAKQNKGSAALGFDKIVSAKALTPTSVEFITDGPDPILLNRLANMFIIHEKSTQTDPTQKGTGAYTAKNGTTPTETELDLVAFDGYHGGHVYTKEVQFRIYKDESESAQTSSAELALTDYQANKLDILNISSTEQLKSLKQTNNNIYSVVSPLINYIGVNTLKTGSAIDKVKFRQAILYGVDVNKIATSLFEANDYKLTSQLVTSEIPGFNAAIKRPDYDLVKAKVLLSESGYKTTMKIPLTISEANKEEGDAIVAELKNIGISANLNAYTDIDKMFNDIDAGDTYLAKFSYVSDLLDSSDVITAVIDDVNYQNKTALKLIDEANQTLDGQKRLTILQQANKSVMDDLPWIPLYSHNIDYAYSNKNLVLTQTKSFLDLSLNFKDVYQK